MCFIVIWELGYRLYDRGLIPCRDNDFFLATSPDLLWDQSNFVFTGYQGSFRCSKAARAPGTSMAEVNECTALYLYSPLHLNDVVLN
jgi:hypothetical protein